MRTSHQAASLRAVLLFADILLCSPMSLGLPGKALEPVTRDISNYRTPGPASGEYSRSWKAGEDAGAIFKRARITTATLGEWTVTLNQRDQYLPVNVAVTSMELFFQVIMGRSIFYNLNGDPELDAFQITKNTLVLSFRCLRGGPGHCVPWPLVTALAQFLMRRAQLGIADRFIGDVSGSNGIVVQVIFDIVTRAGRAAGQEILDSASELHGY